MLQTEKARRTALVNTLSPDSKKRYVRAERSRMENILEEETKKPTSKKKNKQEGPGYNFAPTINERSRKMVMKKRRA